MADSRPASPTPSITTSSVAASPAASVWSSTSIEDSPARAPLPPRRRIVTLRFTNWPVPGPVGHGQPRTPLGTWSRTVTLPPHPPQARVVPSPTLSERQAAAAASARRMANVARRRARREQREREAAERAAAAAAQASAARRRAYVSFRGGFVGGRKHSDGCRISFFSRAWYAGNDEERFEILRGVKAALERDCEAGLNVESDTYRERMELLDALAEDYYGYSHAN